jgi:hypothetical protein
LANIGGYWALFEARSWGEVGRLLPTSGLYKPEVLEAMEEVQNRFMLKNFEPKPFLCREAIEESTFVGHFWELRSSDFSAVSFVGF